MKKILVNDVEYTLEFGFGAVECKDLIQKMFLMLSGGYVKKQKMYRIPHQKKL